MRPDKIKKRNMVIFAIVVLLIMSIASVKLFFLNETYYMAHIHGIPFSDNVKVIKTSVSLSDVYGIHVLAEEIIETKLSWDEVKAIIGESEYGENIRALPICIDDDGRVQIPEYDDYSTGLVKSIEGEIKEGMNYYLINEHTPYASIFCRWEE